MAVQAKQVTYLLSSTNMLSENNSGDVMHIEGAEVEKTTSAWKVERKYKSEFSVNEVVERLINIHIGTQEEE